MILSACSLPRQPRQVLSLLVGMALGMTAQAEVPGVAGSMPEDSLPGLKTALETAVKQSPQMLARSLDVVQAEAGRYANDVGLWPNLNASGGYGINGGRTSDPPSSSRSSGVSYGVNIGQSIFQWGAVKARSDIGKLALQVAEHQYAEAYRSLVGTLRLQYLALVTKKVALRNFRFQLEIAGKNIATLEEKLKDGTVSEGEVISPRLSLQESQLEFARQTQDYEYSKQMFVRLAGLTDLPDDSIPGELARPQYTAAVADTVVETFRRGGPEATVQGQIYLMSVKQNDLNYRIVRTGLLPKFSLGANYNLSNSTSFSAAGASTTQGASYGFGLNGNWPLFDGFATKGGKISALATKRATERQLQTYLETTGDQVQNMRRQIEFVAQVVDLDEQRRALAADAVRRAKLEFDEGTVSQTTLDALTVNFNGSDLTATVARVDYLNRWSDFVSLTGADPILNLLPSRYFNPRHGK